MEKIETRNSRTVSKIVKGESTFDGEGVKLTRVIGTRELSEVDPFLLLDYFSSDNPNDYIGGFPSHPHRGFETVTYMLNGLMKHKDSNGSEGVLRAGGAQWMTAGRGVLHSELPQQEDGLLAGFQLWVNLPSALKMCEPHYANAEPDEIPEIRGDDGSIVRIIAGSYMDTRGAISGVSAEPKYLDIFLPEKSDITIPVEEGFSAFVYVFEGVIEIGEESESVDTGHLAVLGDGNTLRIRTDRSKARAILVAARPFNEPVARYGPFVMNTKEEIETAISDYRKGLFGPEVD